MKPVLPIGGDDGLTLNAADARAIGESLSGDYCFAEPFPHIVLDGFLPEPVIRRAVDHFPREELATETRFEVGYGGQHKRQIMPEDCAPPARALFHFFNSRPFLEFVEGLTAINGLIPDPYFAGGGYHETARGGKLGIHADFRLNDRLALHRRVNVIVYLNETWQDAWGGKLEFWSRDMSAKQKEIAPLFNRAVVFNTDATSYHGHPEPLTCPDGVRRRSLALFYYTASKAIFDEVPTNSSLFRARPAEDAATRRQIRAMNASQYLNRFLPSAVRRCIGAVRRRIPF